MTRIALQFIACTLSVPLCAYLLPGVYSPDFRLALLAGALLAACYLILRPLLRLLTGILSFLTLGLLGVLIDACLVFAVAYLLPGALALQSFWWALAVAVTVNLLRALAGRLATMGR